MTTTTAHLTTTAPETCAPAHRVTKSLLGYGVVVGPIYVTVSLAQALSHDGFDLTRHAWSQLAAGPAGWIQMANLVLAGAMLIAFAVGLSRTVSSRWAPRLLGAFGAGMMIGGVSPADPGFGYPVGVPTPQSPSWPALVHMAGAGLGFLCAAIGLVLLGRTFARQGRRALARASQITGVAFVAAFVALASGSGHPALVIVFTVTVVALFTLIAVIAAQQYRRVGRPA